MNAGWSDARLAEVLASVGENLDVESLAATEARPAPEWSPPRWLAVAAAVAAILVVVTLAVAPVREAVADLLGIGSTGIEIVPEPEADPAGLAPIDAGLTDVTPEGAATLLGQPLPDTTATPLGVPERIVTMPEGGVLLAWSDGATTLWIHGVAMPPADLNSKLVASGEDVETIADLGDDALLIHGSHVLVTPHRRIASGTVLLWTRGISEYRLESNLTTTAMLAIARTLD